MKETLAALGLLLVFANGAANAARDHIPGLRAVSESSTDIIVGEVLDTNLRKALEGARGTVKLKIVSTLKGPLQPGDNVDVYHHLLAVDREKWILETPKFEKGKRYTVFLVNSMGYTLTDQWLAVLADHPRLDLDVALALNEVGELWHTSWRGQHKGPVPSLRRVEIIPGSTVTQTKDGLVLAVKITNHSSQEIVTRLAHEWHGGLWPPTNFYASVSHVQSKQPSNFEPVYLIGERQDETKETRIGPGKSVTIELRMDWPRTGSVKTAPLMKPTQREYYVRLLIVFSGGGTANEYAASAREYVRLSPDVR